jgi:hypothetical protein
MQEKIPKQLIRASNALHAFEYDGAGQARGAADSHMPSNMEQL